VLPQKKVEQQNNENDPKERINKSRQKATKSTILALPFVPQFQCWCRLASGPLIANHFTLNTGNIKHANFYL
jgi:hypothetical protein